MKEAIDAITDELRRLKALGVKTVPVSESSLQALRAATRSVAVPVAPPAVATVAAPVVQEPRPKSTPSIRQQPPAPPALPPAPAFTLSGATKQERWDSLRSVVENDSVCKSQIRAGKKVVLGVGDLDASLFFCGEAPGADEEVVGEPFVGPAGQKLTQILTAMGLPREKVYIGNIMNWRPRLEEQGGADQIGNRPPTDAELNYCLPYLRAQLEIVQPRVIVALGATAAKGLLGPGSFRQVGEVRGRWMTYEGKPLRVTYHPSYLLRQDDMGKVAGTRARRAVWEDMLQVMEKLEMPISDKQRGFFLKT